MRPLPLPRSLLPESSAGSGASAVSALAQAPVVMLVTISWRLWAARRSPAFRSVEHDVLKQHHEEPEREASRCLVRAAVLVCFRDDLMPHRLLPGRQAPVIFRVLAIARPIIPLRQLGNGTRLIIVCLYACMLRCADTEADGSAPCKGDHIHDDRCSDRH